MFRRRPLLALAVVAAAVGLGACGSQGVEVKGQGASIDHGAQLFAQRCSGCHQLDVVGAEGGALEIGGRERVDGPNFNVRKATKDQILYAIRNGGYSGGIMPQHIVTGKDADDVAEFLAKYAGEGEGN